MYSPEHYYTPSQMIKWGCFEIAAPKTLENSQKKTYSEVPFY